jgi:hypothetical protein
MQNDMTRAIAAQRDSMRTTGFLVWLNGMDPRLQRRNLNAAPLKQV